MYWQRENYRSLITEGVTTVRDFYRNRMGFGKREEKAGGGKEGCAGLSQAWKTGVTGAVMFVCVWLVIMCSTVSSEVRAANPIDYGTVYRNENGYEVVFDDDAQLLSEEEAAKLQGEMQLITEYGNVAFKTISTNGASAEDYATDYYERMWEDESGVVFLIDMANRVIYIRTDGKIHKVITNAYANTITDNVYSYASDGNYYMCASEAYAQMNTLLEGGRIAQPMKYICNLLIAAILAFVILYYVVKAFSRAQKPTEAELLEGLQMSREMNNVQSYIARRSKVYSPIIVLSSDGSSSSGSSSGGGGSSGGGFSGGSSGGSRSGGGSSGGGGGHRF